MPKKSEMPRYHADRSPVEAAYCGCSLALGTTSTGHLVAVIEPCEEHQQECDEGKRPDWMHALKAQVPA